MSFEQLSTDCLPIVPNCPDLCRKKQLSAVEKEILDRIDADDEFAGGALLALYERQTLYEQEKRLTFVKNDVGFSAFDAKLFSAIAERIQARCDVTEEDLAVLRKRGKDGISRLGKYRKQIADVMEGVVN